MSGGSGRVQTCPGRSGSDCLLSVESFFCTVGTGSVREGLGSSGDSGRVREGGQGLGRSGRVREVWEGLRGSGRVLKGQ